MSLAGILSLVAMTVALSLAAAPAPANYPWLAGMALPSDALTSLDALTPTPDGFARVPAAEGSLAAWLRGLPVRTDRRTVQSYDGRPLRAPARHVLALDVGSRDLQQCADSAIRLLSEYLWVAGRRDELAWNFTSGDRTRYADWLAGERFQIGRSVERVQGAPRDDSRGTLRAWLDLVFTYAGTRSLAREGEAVTGELRAGDVFVRAGSPGHAVILLDVAAHPDGRRVALVGQGYMPAQDLHVLESSGGASPVLNGIWFQLPARSEDLLDTPSWEPFARADARRLIPE